MNSKHVKLLIEPDFETMRNSYKFKPENPKSPEKREKKEEVVKSHGAAITEGSAHSDGGAEENTGSEGRRDSCFLQRDFQTSRFHLPCSLSSSFFFLLFFLFSLHIEYYGLYSSNFAIWHLVYWSLSSHVNTTAVSVHPGRRSIDPLTPIIISFYFLILVLIASLRVFCKCHCSNSSCNIRY